MQSSISRSGAIALALTSASALSVQACSGDDAKGTDASTDGTPSDVTPQNDAHPTDDSGCPTYSGDSSFCQAEIARCRSCGVSSIDDCQLTSFATACERIGNVLSKQALVQFNACALQCGTNPTCLHADASATMAQEQFVTSYCAQCGPPDDAGGCAAQAKQNQGIGLVNFVSDSIANEALGACIPDAGGPDSSACASASECLVNLVQNEMAGSSCEAGALFNENRDLF